MAFEAWYALAVVVLILGLLSSSRFPPDLVLIGGLSTLLLGGVLTETEALVGFANEGMITIGVLFVVSAGIIETGGVAWIADRLFGRPRSTTDAIARMALPTSFLSAFMNNTPLVAMLIPAVNDWAKHHRIAPSKLMIPLSYAAILGGTCTLIGTSTNLVVNGMLLQAYQTGGGWYGSIAIPNGLGMFDITWVGLPVAVAGIGLLLLAGRWLLPERLPPIGAAADPREYTIEMLVEPSSPLVGKSIEEAGLRHLPGLYLAEIDREGVVLPAVGPEEVLRGNDRLVFVGIVDSMVDLQKIRGLVPATDQIFKLDSPRSQRCLIEAVASSSCPVVGQTIRDGRFRSIYNAVVIAVARQGERIRGKIGDIVLRAGDTLLLEAHPSFVNQHRNSRHFFLVSRLENSNPPRHDRAAIALAIMLTMVALVTFSENWGPLPLVGQITMLKAALVAAGLMIAARCCQTREARRAIDWQVLLAIAASFGIGRALEKTGAADAVTHAIIHAVGGSPWLSLAALYGVTLLVTELITNNAAAALMFPFALATAGNLQVNPMPFIVAVMMAASAGFATPIGYQTNLMVYGPGGYRFTDYLKVGVPLDLVAWALTVSIAPWVWPFHATT
ncbi:MAG: SLC13 family permease [Thermoguttaceae bacterium]|jgi:di/tricarboxylate transporter|nr:SLC13 family permease [Thermoguttaceae bacterium]